MSFSFTSVEPGWLAFGFIYYPKERNIFVLFSLNERIMCILPKT